MKHKKRKLRLLCIKVLNKLSLMVIYPADFLYIYYMGPRGFYIINWQPISVNTKNGGYMMNGENGYSRHKIILEEREKLSITGVTDVIAFDEESITADTDMGVITIRGEGLHISKLNLDEGVLQTDGNVDSIEYGDGSSSSRGGFLLGKIFK